MGFRREGRRTAAAHAGTGLEAAGSNGSALHIISNVAQPAREIQTAQLNVYPQPSGCPAPIGGVADMSLLQAFGLPR